MFGLRWFRRYIRRNVKFIDQPTGEKWHKRLTYLYLFLAWNTCGMVIYMVMTGRKDYALYYGLKTEAEANLPKTIRTLEMLNIKKAKIITAHGFSRITEEEYISPDLLLEMKEEAKKSQETTCSDDLTQK